MSSRARRRRARARAQLTAPAVRIETSHPDSPSEALPIMLVCVAAGAVWFVIGVLVGLWVA